MPHWTRAQRFDRDYAKLPADVKRRFHDVVRTSFVPDVDAGTFRPGLRVKRVRGTRGVFEMTFAPDGRATWEYGPPREPGVPHVRWRRIGSHDVLGDP